MSSFNIKFFVIALGIAIGFFLLPEQVSAAISWNTSASFKTPETLPNAEASATCSQFHDTIPVTANEPRAYNIGVSGATEDPVITCLNCGPNASISPGILPGLGKYATLTWNIQNEVVAKWDWTYIKVAAQVGGEKIYGAICIKVEPRYSNIQVWTDNVIPLRTAAPSMCEDSKLMGEVKVGENKKISFETKLSSTVSPGSTGDKTFTCIDCKGNTTYKKNSDTSATLEWDTTGVDLTKFGSYAMWRVIVSRTENQAQLQFGLACVKIIGRCAKTDATSCKGETGCVWLPAGKCVSNDDVSVKCSEISDRNVCVSLLHCRFEENSKTCLLKSQVNVAEAIDAQIAQTHGMPAGYTGPLPPCAFTGTCNSVEDLVQLGVNVANWLFGIIAGLGFAFFVYGGLTMILSFGNAEKVSSGKQILVAAAIGMIIAFSAYVLISFVVKAIGINPNLVPF